MASTAAGEGEEPTRIMDAPMPVRAAPAAQRIEALDFVRGVALFGILLMNIVGFGLPDSQVNPTNAGGATGANLLVWIVGQIGVEGTQRALFSMLFGASTILLTSRLEASGRSDAADIYFRRSLWLVALGFINAFLFLWWGDILYAYGVAALFLFAFRKLPPRRLLGLGIFVLLLAAAWSTYETLDLIAKHDAAIAAQAAYDSGAELTPGQDAALGAWEGARTAFKATPEGMQRMTEAMRGGYVSAFRQVARINAVWQTWGLYRFFFDMFGMMLIGMGLFRLGVLTLERSTRLYVAMMVAGYAIGITVNVLETRWIIDHQFSAISFAQANISYDVGRLAMTMGHLGVLLLFVRAGMLGPVRRAFAAVGQMAVTNYMMQSVIAAALFVGLGWYNQLERYQLYYVVLATWAFQLVFSVVWLRAFRFGPVEWVWRWLTYLQKPPLRRTAAS
ncbi:DUF418 domain-containing protein [Sphingosinicella sp. LHD-64]|uniref:DUF418 domain-containing protein n=1 Tax=Sphingosinicella sp. LHD-64 TaxID=3072139 RepID=UPI00280D9457|nr:DUF418 domain-containing protein [Sphingosinicella sp. LHD-64]MDQ8757818.1 DUF418 domain-containing protein [Sphingosinicella sp. LHD-64]